MDDFESWGHFSQVVWKGSERVGCATVYCEDGVTGFPSTPWNTICNYGGPGQSFLEDESEDPCADDDFVGNYAGEYADNVVEPLGMATVVGCDEC